MITGLGLNPAVHAGVKKVQWKRASGKEIKEDTETSLTDLRARPVVLIGAMNNPRTMRLLGPMKFHFTPGPIAKVQDVNDPVACPIICTS